MAKVYAARTVMQEIEETRRIAAGEVGLNTLWVPSGTKANLAPQHRMGGLRMSMSRKQFRINDWAMMHNRQRLDPQPSSRDHTRVSELLRGSKRRRL